MVLASLDVAPFLCVCLLFELDDPFSAFDNRENKEENKDKAIFGNQEKKFATTTGMGFFRKTGMQKGTPEDFRSMLKFHRKSKFHGDSILPQPIRSVVIKPPSAYSATRSIFPQS